MTLRDESHEPTRTLAFVGNSDDPVVHCMADILIECANALCVVETMRASIVALHGREQAIAKTRDGQSFLFCRRAVRDANHLPLIHASRTRA